jgi:hypothetical protein
LQGPGEGSFFMAKQLRANQGGWKRRQLTRRTRSERGAALGSRAMSSSCPCLARNENCRIGRSDLGNIKVPAARLPRSRQSPRTSRLINFLLKPDSL